MLCLILIANLVYCSHQEIPILVPVIIIVVIITIASCNSHGQRCHITSVISHIIRSHVSLIRIHHTSSFPFFEICCRTHPRWCRYHWKKLLVAS